jgi:transglutaminase-like putative cysteine protease/predicted esterase
MPWVWTHFVAAVGERYEVIDKAEVLHTLPAMMKSFVAIATLALLTAASRPAAAADDFAASPPPATPNLESRLAKGGTNEVELSRALREAPADRRAGLTFLIENMPDADLQRLSAAFLLDNLNLAYEAWQTAPWHDQISPELFFNDVLPYASLNERREPWRKKLRAECLPMIQGATSPGEAAQMLNRKIFSHFKVSYNTSRHRPDQSPSESIATGRATCTGLSILLVDACRAVGIPARIAGTPMWANMRGNHTWVEIWDGAWHFTGAAEPAAAGLDHAWFEADAARAQRDVPQHAIYATSFRRTGLVFPLVWMPADTSVNAVNVTDRYTKPAAPSPDRVARVAVKVLNAEGKRAEAEITVTDLASSTCVFTNRSRGETADLNDLASFTLTPGANYRVAARAEGQSAEAEITAHESSDQLVTLTLKESPSPAPQPAATPPVGRGGPLVPTNNGRATKPLPVKDAARLKTELDRYFATNAAAQAGWKFPSWAEKLLRRNEPAVRLAAWESYQAAPTHKNLQEDFAAKVVHFGEYTSPYTVKTVGTRPAGGWPLFIALHGGGGAPKALNDSQWKQMQIYYKDHAEAGGYLYLALRAPNDTWNGFYDTYVYPLIDNLILQFRLFGDIDPDKVFILGYSHGGYGAYAIGPKMPDRFAAVHASAAAATDGESVADTLRTTPFTVMVGDRDTMYGRYERNLKFQQQIERLRGQRTDIYPVAVTIVKGNGHTGLPDRDLIKEMYPAVRNPVPREVTWLMTDSVVKDFFWLHVPQPGKQQQILASCEHNRFVITASAGVTNATVLLDSRLVDFDQPVAIELNGATVKQKFTPSLKTLCETLARRGDPAYAFTAEFTVAKDTAGRLALQPAAK